MLGWNIQYGFNDSDFEVSENLLSIYLDEYEETPWDALKYLVSENLPISYNGRHTDILIYGNGTRLIPIRSVIMRVMNKIRRFRLIYCQYDNRQNWKTRSSVTN